MSDENRNPFGDTELGQGLGCAAVIVGIGIAVALIIWAHHYFSN